MLYHRRCDPVHRRRHLVQGVPRRRGWTGSPPERGPTVGHSPPASRERRGLSLDDVGALSRTFADPVTKSYLSRVENGRINLALSKMIPLSRIYEIPPEVLLERLELDMELDKVGGPDTASLDYSELTLRGKTAIDRGYVWDAYAYFRDAVQVAASSAIFGRLRDHVEQFLCALMNLSGAARKLGRAQFALHELKHIHASRGLSGRLCPLPMERLATAYLAMNDTNNARECADAAIAEAEKEQQTEYLGYLYSSRARIAVEGSDIGGALHLFQKAFEAFRETGRESECALTLYNLARTYFSLGRSKSARRALASADRLAKPLQQIRTCALVRILLGEIEEIENKPSDAEQHWRDAVTMARRLSDRAIRFQAEYFLYKQALSNGRGLAARSIEKRLHRDCPWIPQDVAELDAFRQLSSAHPSRARKRVVAAQPPFTPTCNPQ